MKKFILGILLANTQFGHAAIPDFEFEREIKKVVTVAVIDTGVDIRHKDLSEFIWTNPGESGIDSLGLDKSKNNKDDDQNGFVDDIHGWNFIDDTNNVFDINGHGTHVTGIIKSQFLKSVVRKDSSKRLKIMVLKYYDPNARGDANLVNSTKAIRYANKMKADIVNYSGGGLQPYLEEFRAISAAKKLNILFIAAAGNHSSDADSFKFFPANYQLDNIVSVAATDITGTILPSSNFGKTTVDVAALGKDVHSTLPNNAFGILTGTSQATAFVSGLAASFRLENPLAMRIEFLERISERTQPTRKRNGKTRTQIALGPLELSN